jgi:NAD(P)-dependent dehydrogenase (short-subunit alcohol dehydrogenase family)
MPQMQLAGSVVVVTGAASGIGRATTLRLRAHGARVVAVDRDEQALEETAREGDALAVVADVRDRGHGRTVVDAALSACGRLDAVVANAGIGYVGDFAGMPAEALTSLLEVNLRAPMLLTRAALPHLLASGRDAAVVFTTSIAAVVPVPGEVAYCASKGGLEAFADALREELHGTRVAVSTVRPGVVRTAFMAARNDPYRRKWPRPLPPERVGRTVVEVLESGAAHRSVPPWLGLPGWLRHSAPRVYLPLARRLG